MDHTVSRRNQVHSVRKQVELRLWQPVVQVFAIITQAIFSLGGFEVWNTLNVDIEDSLICHKVQHLLRHALNTMLLDVIELRRFVLSFDHISTLI